MLYVFGEWTLGTQRYELSRAGQVRQLRRKAFQVLAYLLAHPDRVVTKQELCEQVWPQQFISDAALESAIKAVRRALGDSGREQRLIQTVYGQGYRFVEAVTTEEQTPRVRPAPLSLARAALPPLGSAPPRPAALRAPVVGREAELAQMACWWERVQGGERHLVFITGEAGIGKTTLIDTWLARYAGEASFWMGRGQCVEQFGAGEPYRPVLEALSRLGRGPSGPEVVACLGAQAPTWLAQMPGLVGPADLETLQRRLAGATRERMLRELAEALEVLTAQQPLVLVLEDLHWSDPSTLDLLAVLARRREPAHLLLLGTYRSPEVRHRAHPLAAVLHELHLHGHSVELPVTVLTEDAIAAYLTRRVPGLPRVDALARLVHQHTEGHPLFMVTLVEAWLATGVLCEQDGVWVLQGGVEALHDQVPDSLRQMIEGQLDRLSPEEQRVLEAASVAGGEFSAAAVAAGLTQKTEQVDEVCTSLARRGQWLWAVGEQSWPDGTVAGGYRFGHALYQQVLYRRVAAARRVRLHQRIGVRKEVGYGVQAGAYAAELAVHFLHGRDYPRAVPYLRQAGENALLRAAYTEALQHLTTGLEVLTTIPETPARHQHELDLLIALFRVVGATKGQAAPELEPVLTRALALCQQAQEPLQHGTVLLSLWSFRFVRAEFQAAQAIAAQLLGLAQRQPDLALLLGAHYALGQTLSQGGAFASARTHLEQGITLFDSQWHATPRSAPGWTQNAGLGYRSRSQLAWVLWVLGYPDQAVQRSQEALTMAHALAHPFSLVDTLFGSTFLQRYRREWHTVQAHAEAMLALAAEHGLTRYVALGTLSRGIALAAQGQHAEGIAQMRQGLAAVQATGTAIGRPEYLAQLATAYGQADQDEESTHLLTEALAIVGTTGAHAYESELHRLQGELLLRQTMPEAQKAAVCFHQALTVARGQQAKSLELRAALSLARLWQQQGQRAEAHALLAPIYGWFTEGFDTADLQEAKALLDELT